jgi:transketolase
MRRAFGQFIADLADRDPNVVLLVGDIGYRIFDEFRARHPSRFYNMGICEQSLIGVSSGMAIEGMKPWVYTITPFLIERPFEQVKLDINEQKVNVKLVGYADYPTLGPTHAELDARLLMSLLKNIKSYFPRDGNETKIVAQQASQIEGPAFISLKSDPFLTSSITAAKKEFD